MAVTSEAKYAQCEGHCGPDPAHGLEMHGNLVMVRTLRHITCSYDLNFTSILTWNEFLFQFIIVD